MWSSITILFALCAATVLPKAVPPYKLPGTNLVNLGSIEDKTYFADDSIPRNWKAASTYCESLGMRLASLETAAQKNFLAAIEHPEFQAFYWTAGRDANSPQQFVWNHNSASVSGSIDHFYYIIEPRTCVIFNSRTGAKLYLALRCEDVDNGQGSDLAPFGALCESLRLF